ncbi:hypothetical protein [Chelativorans salis]|uniref:DUF2946 domain-containing protein n=1 Tax=Chelativorans salis TaxID=2978478 RepID=A0ABT2LHB9_9HYPH|nr:hypothetical protein [Chelativorans sp. EGI FJ00035]MCT7373712.1 hypothetical protein [Chelativorans sp. EGI FJ00035]
MRTMRGMLGDRLRGGILAALVAYVMLLQGLVSAFAQGALAAPQPGSTFIICSLTGAAPGTEGTVGGDPLERAAHHCCAALCHAAASHSPALPTADLGPAFAPEGPTPLHFTAPEIPPRPDALGLSSEARAPPLLSV